MKIRSMNRSAKSLSSRSQEYSSESRSRISLRSRHAFRILKEFIQRLPASVSALIDQCGNQIGIVHALSQS